MTGRPPKTCPEDLAPLLGREPDGIIAYRADVSVPTVRRWLRALGIAPYQLPPAAPRPEPRPRTGPPLRTEGQPRCVQVGVRLTEAELAAIDARREEGETRTAAFVRLADLV